MHIPLLSPHMPRRLFALCSLILLAGCAPSAVGTLDLRTPPAIQGGRLLVVVAPAGLGAPSKALADSSLLHQFVPRAAIGASSYQSAAVGALVNALRSSGRWTDVRIGPLPAEAAFVYGSYHVMTPPHGLLQAEHRRETLAGLTGPPDAFGPDVDAVLVVADAGMGLKAGSMQVTPMSGNPTQAGAGGVTRSDDAVVARAALVLWNDAAGAPVAAGTPSGSVSIPGRLLSSDERRSPRGLAWRAVAEFLADIAAELPAL